MFHLHSFGSRCFDFTGSREIHMLITSSLTFCIHIPLCWALVYNTGFGNIGAAIALSISISLNTAFIGLYIRFSSACSKTRVPISMKLFKGIGEFLRFAFPSAIMFIFLFNL
ncbi:hypothetical protein S245_068439 [Arachis hypogaea]|uniref:Protein DETOXIFICATION n=1 Tax=Arachis hypogaea TaxID=3818 RepID=A0A6B9VGJ5_ARAHY|nr:Protein DETOXIFICATION [Arachis hypogaea]